ncbi:methylenetetrahydrofolate reductase [NAD(P)H] [Succinimonas amylolytica]|uniref:methylenetetrahydrofolate reductase [NAD(P)H] n=1 Tax=Succinimonas amylolytica TaxID=83769 RepID=UPI0023A7ADED
MSTIASIFENKTRKPVISFEIFPPKRDELLKNIDATLAVLASMHPDFVSVTFGAGGSVTNSATVEIASKIKKLGIESVAHLTCLNYSKAEILTMIRNLEASGIENILALRGDSNPNAEPKNDFVHARDLIAFVRENSSLGISAACYPEGHPEAESLDTDIRHLKEKVDAGATHLISQLFFDNDIFYRFMDKAGKAGINVPVDAGIMPVVNKAQIERMISLCGASLPEKFRKILDRYENDREALFDAGMAYAVSQIIDLIASGVEGIHIYTMNNPKIADRLTSAIKNLF